MNPDRQADDKPIGGFFELEIPGPQHPIHQNAIALSTGRSCICAFLEFAKPGRCHVPQYTCDATLVPFEQYGVELAFYDIDENFEPLLDAEPGPDEYFLFTNYWGLQRSLASELSDRFADRLIVDDTHDFFSFGEYPKSWSFTSARKYFGVPDGAFLYTPESVNHAEAVPSGTPSFDAISLEHSLNRLKGFQEKAFQQFQDYEKSLPCALHAISYYSLSALSGIDMESVLRRRKENFAALAEALNDRNTIDLQSVDLANISPFVYPFLPSVPIQKKHFYAREIFVPTLWPDVLTRPGVSCQQAIRFATRLLPLPIDHRYGKPEMTRMVDFIRDREHVA